MLNCLSSNTSMLFGLLIGNTSMFAIRCQFIDIHLDKMFRLCVKCFVKFIVWGPFETDWRREFYREVSSCLNDRYFFSVHPFFSLSEDKIPAKWPRPLGSMNMNRNTSCMRDTSALNGSPETFSIYIPNQGNKCVSVSRLCFSAKCIQISV